MKLIYYSYISHKNFVKFLHEIFAKYRKNQFDEIFYFFCTHREEKYRNQTFSKQFFIVWFCERGASLTQFSKRDEKEAKAVKWQNSFFFHLFRISVVPFISKNGIDVVRNSFVRYCFRFSISIYCDKSWPLHLKY